MDRLAIVIGIGNYTGGIPGLTCAVSDARAVAGALGAHGFCEADGSLIPLYDADATHKAIHDALTVRLPAAGTLEQVIVYFAGHGQAVPDERLVLRGSLLPVDAALGGVNYIEMDVVREKFSTLTCRHLLVVLDCCAAGAFARARHRDVGLDHVRMFRARFDSLRRRRSYQLLASAGHDQQALDRFDTKVAQDQLGPASPFARAFLDALKRQDVVDSDRCGVVDATRVFQHVRAAVNQQFPDQLPNLWPLDWHDNGEFLFLFGAPRFFTPNPLERNDSPYAGAAPIGDSSLYFGREETIEKVVRLLVAHGIALVTGASGAGTTSLVARVRERIGATGGAELLIVDGLNALSPEARAKQLAAVVARAPGVRALIAGRDDLAAECADLVPPVARVEVLRMDRDAMRDAIELPAARRYMVFSPAFGPANRHLVDALLDEVDGAPCGLALLAIALADMFDAYIASQRDDRTIAWSEYVSIATLAAQRAEAVHQFEYLEPTERAASQASLRDLVLRLTRSGDGALERRRLPRAVLQFADPAETARTARVLDAMIAARVVVAERGYVELVLHALLAAWPRIAAWHAGRPTEVLQRLGDAALVWAPKRRRALLWADERLAELRPLASGRPRLSTRAVLAQIQPSTLTRIEREFVVRSEARRRAVTTAAWLATVAVLIVLGVAAVYSAVQRSAAEDARGIAEARERDASHLLALSYVEEARHLLVDKARPLAALPYLAAARERGLATPALGTMFGIAAAALPDTPRPIAETLHPIATWLDDDRVLLGSPADVQAYSRSKAVSVGPHIAPARGIEKIAVSRTGDRVLTGGGGVLVVWDAVSGRPLGEKIPVEGALREVGFSADGSRVWAVAARVDVWRTVDHARIGSLTYSNSDAQLDATAARALVSVDPAEVRDVATGERLGPPIDSGFRQVAALFPDGRTLATALDNTVEVWDVTTGQRLGPKRGPRPPESSDRIVEVVTDAAGTRAVTSNEATHAAQVWSARGERVTEPFGNDVIAAELDQRGALVLTVVQTGYQLWDAASGVALSPVLEQAFSTGAAYELSPGGAALAVANHTGHVQLWDLGRLLPKRGVMEGLPTEDDAEAANVVAVCPSAAVLVTETGALAHATWDPALQRATPLGAVGRLAACSGIGHLLVVSPDGAESWDVASGTHVALADGKHLVEATFTPDGGRIYAPIGKMLFAWNAATGARDPSFVAAEVIPRSALAVRPDGAIIAWSNHDRAHLHVFSASGTPRPDLDLALAPAADSTADQRIARFSRNGAVLVLVTPKPDSAVAYSTQTGAVLGSIAQLPESLHEAAPSSDGSLVALVFGASVQVWDVATARAIAPMFPHAHEPRAVEFGAGDTTLVTSDAGGQLLVWPLPRDDGNSVAWAATAARSPYLLVNGELKRR